jgi:hypothetical protein
MTIFLTPKFLKRLMATLDKGPGTKRPGTNLKQIEPELDPSSHLKKHFFLRYTECVYRLGVQFEGSISKMCDWHVKGLG